MTLSSGRAACAALSLSLAAATAGWAQPVPSAPAGPPAVAAPADSLPAPLAATAPAPTAPPAARADSLEPARPAGSVFEGERWNRVGADVGAPADTTDEVRERPVGLTAFGYYRLFLYGRDFDQPYPNLPPFERVYGVGDGYREPSLSLNILGRPNGRTSFGTELFV